MKRAFLVIGFLFVVLYSCTKKLPPISGGNKDCDTCFVDTIYQYCRDTGSAGYFPNSVGSWWAYETIKGSSLNEDSSHVRDTIAIWAETTRVVNDSTWINTYYGGPYDGYQDTFYVFLRGDTIILNVRYSFKPPTDTTTIPINLLAPFGIYPLIYPLSWETPWDTLPPANYIGDTATDTIMYNLRGEVKNDTTTINVGPENLCSQKVKYTIRINVVHLGLANIISYMFWIPYRGIGRRIELDLRDTTGGFPTKWLEKNLKGYNIP